MDFTEAVRQSPARPATVESDFLVIALQAIGCGVAACLLSIGASFAFDWPWWVPVVTLGGTMSLAWFVLLTDQRKLLRVVERIVGRDIDGDGAVGEPEPPSISIEVTDPENRQIAYDVLPADEDMLRDVALAVFRKGCSFSRRELASSTSLSSDEIIKLQRGQSVLRRLSRIWPMKSKTRTVPRQAINVAVNWTGEGAVKTETKPTWGQLLQTAKKVTAISKMSDEWLEDNTADGDRFLMELIADAIALDGQRSLVFIA